MAAWAMNWYELMLKFQSAFLRKREGCWKNLENSETVLIRVKVFSIDGNGRETLMPTYEYQCDSCDYRFEQFQTMKAEPIKICPQCRGSVRRLIGSGAGVIFKGSGFYQTDYRSPSYQKKAEAEKKTSSAKDSKPVAESKSEQSPSSSSPGPTKKK